MTGECCTSRSCNVTGDRVYKTWFLVEKLEKKNFTLEFPTIFHPQKVGKYVCVKNS
jgi:hypothetical protein